MKPPVSRWAVAPSPENPNSSKSGCGRRASLQSPALPAPQASCLSSFSQVGSPSTTAFSVSYMLRVCSFARPPPQWASVTWPSLDSWWASICERSFHARLRAETRAVPASSLFLITYQTAHQKKAHRLQFQNLLEAISLAMPLTLLARSKPRSDHLLTGCSCGLLAGALAYLSASCSSPFTHSQPSLYHCFLQNVLQCPWPN